MDYEVFVTAGLGDNTFMVVSGEEAVLVDPQRDAWRFLAAAEARGVRLRAALETHVHNDYISGVHEVRAATGAEIVAPAKGNYSFPHTPAEEGTEVRIGDLVLRAWETPGHTFEHISWAAHAGSDTPLAVFSGGSLLVGSAGRTDLLGPDHVEALTRHQFETVARYRALPAQVELLPTHGAGSFCVSTLPSAARTSTMGMEKEQNGALTAPDGEAFFRQQLSGLMEYPRYYAFMAPLNRQGARLFGQPPKAPRVDPGSFEQLHEAGAIVIDARDRETFAAAHIPGSLNVELNDGFGTYVGWVTPFDSEIALVLPDDEGAQAEALAQLIRVGYDRTVGILDGGIDAWVASGREAVAYPVGTTKELRDRLAAAVPTAILDVRQPGEWNSEGIIPGSTRIFVGDLPAHVASLPRDEEFWIFCTNGHRASLAASMLDAQGVPVRLIAKSGVLGLLDHLEPYEAVDAAD